MLTKNSAYEDLNKIILESKEEVDQVYIEIM